jgi:hypothetical protein
VTVLLTFEGESFESEKSRGPRSRREGVIADLEGVGMGVISDVGGRGGARAIVRDKGDGLEDGWARAYSRGGEGVGESLVLALCGAREDGEGEAFRCLPPEVRRGDGEENTSSRCTGTDFGL